VESLTSAYVVCVERADDASEELGVTAARLLSSEVHEVVGNREPAQFPANRWMAKPVVHVSRLASTVAPPAL